MASETAVHTAGPVAFCATELAFVAEEIIKVLVPAVINLNDITIHAGNLETFAQDISEHILLCPEYDGEWRNWNPKKIWVPSKKGLGMRKVFEDLNRLYGKGFIKYE